MTEITVIDEKPHLVAGMRRKGHYKEIAKMLPSLFEYIMSKKAIIVGHPLFLCHETGVEEAKRADETGNARIESAYPLQRRSRRTIRSNAMSLMAERWPRRFIRALSGMRIDLYEAL